MEVTLSPPLQNQSPSKTPPPPSPPLILASRPKETLTHLTIRYSLLTSDSVSPMVFILYEDYS